MLSSIHVQITSKNPYLSLKRSVNPHPAGLPAMDFCDRLCSLLALLQVRGEEA